MLINRKPRIEERSVQVVPLPVTTWQIPAVWPQFGVGLLFVGAWLAVVLGAASMLPLHFASWLTFFGLLIGPGYLLGDLLVRAMDLDWLERLALAFPLGMVILSIPGLVALLQHRQVDELAAAWVVCTAVVAVVWVLSWLWLRPQSRGRAGWRGWSLDEALLLVLIAAVFVWIMPVLNQHKIDGDTLAVGSFSADAMAGLPLNQFEPLFGTDLGPGVRMAFNQSLPMLYLWSYWSGIDPMMLMGSATRAMLAMWALLATYMLGKSAGVGVAGSLNGRRIGLFAVAIQVIIFVAAPFFRGDNVSLFFFERIAADKFMVPVTMLPVAFALAIRYVRLGEWPVWGAAALVAFAVSAIHPLVAAMLALGLTAFGALHFILRLRDWVAFRRSFMLAGLVVIVMVLPLVQLALSRGEEPLASSYPSSFEGWQVEARSVPALPFIYVPTLDVYGPLPDLSQIEAEEALTATDPFLIWRFAVNMERRRLILFDLNSYISDPNILLEPPYLLALLLLPLLLRSVRRSLGAQFVLAATGGILFVMYNPLVTPLLGGLVMPWILWRFVWMLPYALILALAGSQILGWTATALARMSSGSQAGAAQRARRWMIYAPVGMVLIVALAATPAALQNVQTLDERAGFPYFFPHPSRLLNRLNAETTLHGPAVVMADADLSVTIPAYVPHAHIVAHRVPTTSEIFPANRQTEALQRLIDQEHFYQTRYLTTDAVEILQRYDARYVITTSGSNLDIQLRLAGNYFELLSEDQSYALYAVGELSPSAALFQANSALAQRQWTEAERLFRAELARNPVQVAAWAGLGEIAHARGEFATALDQWGHALTAGTATGADLAAIHFRRGQLLGDLGRLTASIETFETAIQHAPHVARFRLAMGDACLRAQRMTCAADAFQAAVAYQNLPDEVSRTVTLADLWRQRGQIHEAIPLYELAASQKPSELNQLILVGAYQEAARYGEAGALLDVLRVERPLSPEVWTMTADVLAAQNRFDEAVQAYTRAIGLLEWMGRESVQTRLALAGVLLQANRTTDAQAQIDWVLALEPNNASAYSLRGEVHTRFFRATDALPAYENAFRLDPTSVQAYLALSNQFRSIGGSQSNLLALLQAAMRANPREAALALILGDHLHRSGDIPAAAEAYLAALDLFEQRSGTGEISPRITNYSRAYAYVRLAGVHEDLGQVEPAMNFYRAAVAAAPNAAWAQVAYGDALRRQNQPLPAELAYRRAMRVDSTFVPAYLRLADLQSARGWPDEAAQLRSQAFEMALVRMAQPEIDAAFSGFSVSAKGLDANLAVASFSSDETASNQHEIADAARRMAQENAIVDQMIVRLTGENMRFTVNEGSTILNLAGRLSQTGSQVEVLMDLYLQAIQQGEREGWYPVALAQYYKGLGDLYLTQNQALAAVDAYRQAATLDSGWSQARLGLANALNVAGDADEAMVELEALAESAPGFAEAQVALAQQYAQFGEVDEALAMLQQTAAVQPGNVLVNVALAQTLQDQQAWPAAERIYQQTLAIVPGSLEARTGYAALLLERARHDEAAVVLAEAHELDRNHLTAHLLSAVLAQRNGDAAGATEWLLRAAGLPDATGANQVLIADLLGRFGLNQAALGYLAEVTAPQPDQVELLLRKARTERATGEYGSALATLLGAADQGLTDARLTVELAEVYLAQGRRQTGLVTYRQAVNLDPTQAAYTLRLAELWRDQGDYAQAEAILKQGIHRVEQPAALYAVLSELYLRWGKTEDARALLKTALELYDNEPVLVVAMGAFLEAQALRSLAASDSAEQWYLEALATMGDAVDVHAALADHYLRRNRLDQAQAHFETALELAPTNARHYLGLGAVYQAKGDLTTAETVLRKAIWLEPGLIDGYSRLIELYKTQRNWDAVRALFVQAKQVAPANGELHVQYAAFLLERGETELGMEMLAQATTLSPTARTLAARAEVYAKLRRRDTAMADLQQALAWEPGFVDAHVAMGDLYREMGNNRAARDAYGKAVQLNPGLGLGRLRLARVR